jgi:predicted Zn-dependent protease
MLLLLVGLLCLGAGCAVNPLTGEEEFMLMSVDEDFKLGRTIAPEIEKELYGTIPDDTLQRYIDRIGQRLARVSHHPEWEYHFTAVESDMVNALALPGGYIYITRGLLDKLDSEAQLAAILGHELGHVVARDTAVALSRQQGMNLAMAGVIAASDASGDVIQAAAITSQILMLSYSRKDEYEADMAGLRYMVSAGYHPQGMIEVMTILQESEKVRPIEFFSTHPLPENRLRYLQDTIAYRYSDTTGLRLEDQEYQRYILDFLKTHPKPKKRQIQRKQSY